MINRAIVCLALVLCCASTSLSARQSSINYVYDELGRLSAVIDPNGDTAVYHYDTVGNVTSIDRHPSSQVSIISFSPGSGPVGTTVTVRGTGFSVTPNQNTVTFNGTAATVSTASATQLVVTVPSGATTGTIAVSTSNGSAPSATVFTVGAASVPTITSFSPSIGSVGTAVTVAGTNFELTPANDRLSFNVSLATVSAATTTSLTTSVPALTGSGPIMLITPLGTATSATDFFVPPAPYVPTDVAFTARMTTGASQVVTISTANKIGLITFAGTAGQRISLKGTNGMSGQVVGCDVNVSIMKADNSVLAPGSCMEGSGFIDVKTLPTTGTYTIVVDPSGTATGSLTLTLYDVPADPTSSITAGGAAVTVTTTTPGQNASLTFTGAAGQRVSLKGTNGLSGQVVGCDVNVSILNPDGSVLAAPSCMEGSGFIDVKTLGTTETYTIKEDLLNIATGSVTLTLYDVPADLGGTLTPGGAALTVTTTTPGQNATLTFSGTAGQRISLKGTNGMSGQVVGCDVNVSILNPDNSVLAAPACMEASGFIDVKTLSTTGTYTIKVDPLDIAAGSLTLTLYDVPADPSTTVTIGGSSATLTTSTPGQNAQATFSGTSGQQATVHVTNNTMSWVTVKLLKPDGAQLTSTYSFQGSFNLATQTLPTTGTYTIVIDPDSANVGSITINVTNP